MRYDAVLFDLDGTMTESAPGIYASVRYAMERMGRPRPGDDILRNFIGPPLYDSLPRHLGLNETEVGVALDYYREYYGDRGVLDARVFTGIPNLLRRLKEAGVYLAVASAKPTHSAQIVLDHFGLSRFFDRIIGAERGKRDTSKAEILRAALPARYERAAMVGDRLYDMEAAKAVGVDAVGAGWGYGSEAELTSAGADAVVPTVEALEALLLDQVEPLRGFFVTIEGLDGSGKTTQMNAIAEYMRARGYDVLTTREPGGTPVSEEIRHLVLDPGKEVGAHTEALLYAAARAQHVRTVIRPALAKGRAVLCDRFVDSSIAYQGAGRELGMERVAAINAFATGGTEPDLTPLLMVDAQTSLLRRSSATRLDRLERSGEAFFGRVYDAYAQLARLHPERIRRVDAQQDIEAVTAEVCGHIERMLASR